MELFDKIKDMAPTFELAHLATFSSRTGKAAHDGKRKGAFEPVASVEFQIRMLNISHRHTKEKA